MKNNKIILAILFVIAMFVYYVIYAGRPDPEVFVMKPSIEVGVRKVGYFVEEYSPKESLIKVKCSCENPLIASVNADHISVTGKYRGTTLLTCTFNGKELGTTEITVQ